MISFLVGFVGALLLFGVWRAVQPTGMAFQQAISAPGEKTCAALGGKYCSISQECSDSSGGIKMFTTAPDSARCCIGSCTPYSTSQVDLNGDGEVTAADLAIIESSIGVARGDARYNAAVDANGDGIVDIADLTLAAQEISSLG